MKNLDESYYKEDMKLFENFLDNYFDKNLKNPEDINEIEKVAKNCLDDYNKNKKEIIKEKK